MYRESLPAQFIYDRLEEVFHPERVTDVFPKVGIQEHNTETVKKVYTACFASPEVFENLLSRGEKDIMLFCHHPRAPKPTIGGSYIEIPQETIQSLKDNRINFFAYHIPMDAYGPWSTGAGLAKALGTVPYEPWYPQNGGLIGGLNQSSFEDVYQLKKALEAAVNHRAALYLYGDEKLNDGKFAIMTGGAKSTEVYEFLENKGINTFVLGATAPTADFTKAIHQAAKEHRINLMGATHYSTEKFAPYYLCDYFRSLGLQSEFIPEQPDMRDI